MSPNISSCARFCLAVSVLTPVAFTSPAGAAVRQATAKADTREDACNVATLRAKGNVPYRKEVVDTSCSCSTYTYEQGYPSTEVTGYSCIAKVYFKED